MTVKLISWQSVPTEQPELWGKMVDNFWEIHQAHCDRVHKNILAYIQSATLSTRDSEQLLLRMSTHDISKTWKPEFAPYVWRYWRTTIAAQGQKEAYNQFYADPTLDQAIRDAVFHHITYNRHHPEWHPDPDDMTNVDIVEMCCDWMAMSQEFGSSIDAWAEDVIPRRYHFGKRRQYVLDTIAVLKSITAGDNLK